MLWRASLIFLEVILIAYLGYRMAGTYYSLDVLFCVPIVQAARFSSIPAFREWESHSPLIVGVLCALVWSLAEAAVTWPDFPLSAFIINVVTRSIIFTVLGSVMTRLWKEREYSRKDSLTGLANRLEFVDRFKLEQFRSERSKIPYSILFIDINDFKKLNDKFGHQVGDAALVQLATILKESFRVVDTISRIGGDEFVLLLPETDEAACEMLASRIANASAIKFTQSAWPISLAVGGATEIGKKRSVEVILREADEKMYANKKQSVGKRSADLILS